jgi:hypothetical protein
MIAATCYSTDTGIRTLYGAHSAASRSAAKTRGGEGRLMRARKRRRLSQQDLQAAGVSPGLMVHRVGPNGRGRFAIAPSLLPPRTLISQEVGVRCE